ncbi:Lysophospholipase/Carboxylesterase [Chlorociboria aeruginascens]|nr:Lysophospholipase/Carboxylesterase [Chlorociboria aeruginascens]
MHFARSLSVLCFGDSLTAGFPVDHPYAISLRSTLQRSLQSVVRTDIEGVSGDRVTSPPGQFLPRMHSLFVEHKPFDWAVILGGTNDLNTGREPDETYEALQRVWDIPLSHGSRVLSLTVPECACAPELDAKRDDLNGMILSHKAPNFYTFDLHAAIPYWNMTEERRNKIWVDAVHFTPAGYDLMGTLVSNRLRDLIVQLERERGGAEEMQKPIKWDLGFNSEFLRWQTTIFRKLLRKGRLLIM